MSDSLTGICPHCNTERTTRFLDPNGGPCFMCYLEDNPQPTNPEEEGAEGE